MSKPGRVTEQQLVDVLVQYFEADHIVGYEVEHYERRIDVVVLRSDTDELWAIEAKVAAWKRAISQAVVSQVAAQRSYVAMYDKHAHRVDRSLLDEQGIGLIAVGTRRGQVKILKDAPISRYMNPLMVNNIRSQLLMWSKR